MTAPPRAGSDAVVVLDFEATCLPDRTPSPQEIIEFPSIAYDIRRDEVLGEFTSFVRPAHHPRLSEFCRTLTSIEQRDVDAAPPFPSVFHAHQEWLADLGLVGHDGTPRFTFATFGDWDLRTMLPHQIRAAIPPVGAIPRPYRSWCNLRQLFAAWTREEAADIPAMMAFIGSEFTGTHHRGIDDCRNLLSVVRAMRQEGIVIAPTASLHVRQHPPLEITFSIVGSPGITPRTLHLKRRSVLALTEQIAKVYPDLGRPDLLTDGTRPLSDDALLDADGHLEVQIAPVGART